MRLSNFFSNKRSFLMSLWYTPSAVRTITWHTISSLSGKVCSTKALGQCPRGVFLSAIKTKLPTPKLGFGHNHFCSSWSVDKYSFVHLHQSSFARRWTRFHLSLNLSDSSNTSGQTDAFLSNRRIWFGVSASKSCRSLDTEVIGLSFRIFSNSAKDVCKASSFRSRSSINECKIPLIKHISLSHTPHRWLAAGGLNFHSIPFLVKVAWILSWSHTLKALTTSNSAPLKLIPLSL